MTVMIATTPFPAAQAHFQAFLAEQGADAELVWLFREDVLARGRRLLVRWPVRAGNEQQAEAYYEIGRERGRGVSLEAFCRLPSGVGCYIYVPESELEVEYRLISKVHVKYSVRTPLRPARPVASGLLWSAYAWRASWATPDDDVQSLPSRDAVGAPHNARA
jgi:hypothetical protein